MSRTEDTEMFLLRASEKRLIESEFKYPKKNWGWHLMVNNIHNMEPAAAVVLVYCLSDKDCVLNAECVGHDIREGGQAI